MDYKTGREICELLSDISLTLENINKKIGDIEDVLSNIDSSDNFSESEIKHYKERTKDGR